MTALDEIVKLANKLPRHVLQDIDSRTKDHLASGGGHDDPYIHQQLRYARNVIRSAERHAATNNI